MRGHAADLRRGRVAELRRVDRERIRELRVQVTALRQAIARQRGESLKERRKLLRGIKSRLKGARRVERSHRHRLLAEVADARVDYQRWLTEVRAEQARRLAELAQTRELLRRWRAGARERVRAALANVERVTAERLAQLDARTADARAELVAALEQAQRDLWQERQDQRQFRRTGRQVTKRTKRTSRRERAEECGSGVEANLTSAEEFAVWKHARRQVLAAARAQGVTASDQIAELVREYAEANPEQALDWLQNDSDAWLEAELSKGNYR